MNSPVFWGQVTFNNWDKSENPNISVGLTYDYRKYPLDKSISPEDEFYNFIAKFPSVAKQFENATTTLPWVRSERLQYSSRQMAGDRYCLLSHASDFIDALYSRGMINTTEINRLLSKKIIHAFKSDNFSRENFVEVEELQNKMVSFADRLARCSYISWGHYPLWNLVVRIWAIGTLSLESNLGGYMKMHKVKGFEKHNMLEEYVLSPFEHKNFGKFFVECESIILKFDKGEITPDDSVQMLETVIKNFEFDCTLPNKSDAHIWALKNPGSKDIFLGNEQLTKKWNDKVSDIFA